MESNIKVLTGSALWRWLIWGRQRYLPSFGTGDVSMIWNSEDGMPLGVAQTQDLAFLSSVVS